MCGSQEINPGLHGRPTTGGEPAIHSDLCDICYWRVNASTWEQLYDMQKEQYDRMRSAIIEFYRWKYGDDALSVSEIISEVMSHAPNAKVTGPKAPV
jgi:hypothetical protein